MIDKIKETLFGVGKEEEEEPEEEHEEEEVREIEITPSTLESLFEAKRIYPHPPQIMKDLWLLKHGPNIAYARIPFPLSNRYSAIVSTILNIYFSQKPRDKYTYLDLINELQIRFMVRLLIDQAVEGWAKSTETTGREPPMFQQVQALIWGYSNLMR